jgi:DUF971 family protein
MVAAAAAAAAAARAKRTTTTTTAPKARRVATTTTSTTAAATAAVAAITKLPPQPIPAAVAVSAALRARRPTAASIAAAAAKAAAKSAQPPPHHVQQLLLKQQREQHLTWENKTRPALDAELVRISSVPTSLGVVIPNATGLRENVAKIEHQHMANSCRAILSTWSPMLRKAVNKSVNGGFHVFSVPLYIPGESNTVLANVDEVVRVLAPILKNGGYTIKRETVVPGARTVRISW